MGSTRSGDQLSSFLPSSFACAVCPHRPVLDTVAMLTAHRAGKKHLSSKSEGRRGIETTLGAVFNSLPLLFRSAAFLWQEAARRGNGAESKTTE